jgi:hypothetical protein
LTSTLIAPSPEAAEDEDEDEEGEEGEEDEEAERVITPPSLRVPHYRVRTSLCAMPLLPCTAHPADFYRVNRIQGLTWFPILYIIFTICTQDL